MGWFPLGQVSVSIQSFEAGGEVIWGNMAATESECDGQCLDNGLDTPFYLGFLG